MNRFLEEDGQGMVEYALIVALIAVACIVAFRLIGTSVQNKAKDVNKGLGGTDDTAAPSNVTATTNGTQGGAGNTQPAGQH